MIEGLAKHTDPQTSKDAAMSVDAGALMLLVYAAMKPYGDDGCISDQIEEDLVGSGHKIDSISPRFAQMVRAGVIELTGRTRKARSGRQQDVRRVLPQPWEPPKRLPKTQVQVLKDQNARLYTQLMEMSSTLSETTDALAYAKKKIQLLESRFNPLNP